MLSVRKMRLVSTGSGRAMTEILISDNPDEKLAVESLSIRVTIPLSEINVRTAETAAIKRAGEICEDLRRCLDAPGTDPDQ